MIRFVRDVDFLRELGTQPDLGLLDVDLVDVSVLRDGIPRVLRDAQRPINVGLLDLIAWRRMKEGRVPYLSDGVEINCIVPTFGTAENPGCIRLLYEWACDAHELRRHGATDFPTPMPKFLEWDPGVDRKTKPLLSNLMNAALGQFLVSGLSQANGRVSVRIYSSEGGGQSSLRDTLDLLRATMMQKKPLPSPTHVACEEMDPLGDLVELPRRFPDSREEGWDAEVAEANPPYVVVDTNCVSAVSHHYVQVKGLFVNVPAPDMDWCLAIPSIAIAEMAIHSMWPVKEVRNEETGAREVKENWQDWNAYLHVGGDWFRALQRLLDLRDKWSHGPVVVRDMSRHAAQLLGDAPWPRRLSMVDTADLAILASCVHPQGRNGDRHLVMGRLETRDDPFRKAVKGVKIPVASGGVLKHRLIPGRPYHD